MCLLASRKVRKSFDVVITRDSGECFLWKPCTLFLDFTKAVDKVQHGKLVTNYHSYVLMINGSLK